MSRLDDIRFHAHAAGESLDEAWGVVNRASDEAGDLAETAAGHGWAGLARGMNDVQETLQEVASTIDGAIKATADSVPPLSELTDEKSSDEVAATLRRIGAQFDVGRAAVSRSMERLGDARSSADLTDAESLGLLIGSAQDHLGVGGRALDAATTAVEAEQSDAATWGNSSGDGPVVSPSKDDNSVAMSGDRPLPPGQPLPNGDRAIIPEPKFLRYSMDPKAKNNGKWKAWGSLGYDIDNDRQGAADDVIRQLRRGLSVSRAEHAQQTPHGLRLTTGTHIRGPNGHAGTLRCVWQYDRGSDEPRLITNWLEVHKEQR